MVLETDATPKSGNKLEPSDFGQVEKGAKQRTNFTYNSTHNTCLAKNKYFREWCLAIPRA